MRKVLLIEWNIKENGIGLHLQAKKHYVHYRHISYSMVSMIGRNALKTYIIEIHEINKETNYDTLLSTPLSKATEVDNKAKVIETEEESLLRLHTNDGEYFVDTTSKSDVILHSASSTKITDSFIRKFQNTKGLGYLFRFYFKP